MTPKEFYSSEHQKCETLIRELKKKAFLLSMVRLVLFLAIPISLYVLIDNTTVLGVTVLLLIVAFLFFVKRSARNSDKLVYQKNKLEIVKSELDGFGGNYKNHNSGSAYKQSQHAFTHDLDIFGERSLFQYINRTATQEGEELLADWINNNSIEDVSERQLALEELKISPEDRLHFHAQAKTIEQEVSPSSIFKYFKEYKSFVPTFWKYLVPVFTLGSIAAVGLAIAGVIPNIYLLFWFLFGCSITAIYFKRVTKVQQRLDKARHIFLNYSKLIQHLESKKFDSKILQKHHAVFRVENTSYSAKLAKLYEHLNALDQRQNMVFALIGAGLLLWDIKQMLKIEKWIEEQTESVGVLFNEIAFFDAYYALAHFNYINADYCIPRINTEGVYMGKNIIHPLMPKASAIANSFNISKGEFYIITGANMAGKSTFLRTVGTSIVMANLGLRIRADEYSYTPIKVISSMRTEDSLQDNESYFFAELQRLQFINKSLEKDPCFVILDEILKGTNSKDKAEGSRKYVATLIRSKATGIIATHDLSLCELSDLHSEISNYCFEAQIENNELYFDYKFKTGICQNMNASFLLKKMGLIDD